MLKPKVKVVLVQCLYDSYNMAQWLKGTSHKEIKYITIKQDKEQLLEDQMKHILTMKFSKYT